MPKFNVLMTRLACVVRREVIEAGTKEDAEAIAMKNGYEDDDGGWKVDDIFDDGKNYSKLEIIDVAELDENGFEVES